MVKKVVCVLIAFVCLIMLWTVNQTKAFNQYDGITERYYNAYSSNCKINDGSLMLKTGEAIFINDKLSLEQILMEYKGVLVGVEKTESAVNYYAFSPKFKVYKLLNGERVNLHICITETATKIGTPLIFGSF